MNELFKRRGFLALLALSAWLVVAGVPGTAFAAEATLAAPGPGGPAAPPGLAGKGEGPWAKADSILRQVVAAYRAHQASAGGAPFEPGFPAVRYADGLVLIDAIAADGDGAALLAQLQALGLKDGTAYRTMVSGFMPLGRLQQAVELGSLRAVSASLKPETNSTIDPTFGLVHDRRGAIAMNLIAGEAVPQAFTGAGIKVGILSDTFDNNGGTPATDFADDLANGDLPGSGAYVALHTPGDVDDNDHSSFGANGTSGSNTSAGDPAQWANRAASIRFNPASFYEDPITAEVAYSDANQYAIGAQPFTIEMWARFETTSTDGFGPILASQYLSAGDQRGWFLIPRGPGDTFPNALMFWASPDGTSANSQFVLWPWTPAANTWYHIAVSRDASNDMRAFINGQEIGAAQPLNISIFDTSEPLRIGSYRSAQFNNRPFDGWIEDFRFVVGEALYTANFTPVGALTSSLPPSAGPTTTVVQEGSSAGIDEGRAMAQLVHDVAPDASISFHSAFNGMASFAQGIEDLAADGASVIVDDIIYFAEPMFQDGIVAQAVDTVVGQGVAYFSSAGNSAQRSYESPFVSSGESLSVGTEARGTLHDFDPGAGTDFLQSVTVPRGTTITVVLQWDQPAASNCAGCPGAQNDMDIYLVDDDLQIYAQSISDNLTNGEPIEVLQFANPSVPVFGTDFNIMIAHYDVKTPQHPRPGSPPGLMKYVWFGSSTISVNEYNTNSAASYGHANAAGAAGVGAAFYLNTPAFGVFPPVRESYSSRGGVPILFDVAGNALGAAEVRERPRFVAPDGTNTTFFYRDTSLDDADEAPATFPNFFGTSAAAPHAAAVAALMREANPALTPGDIYAILENTAVDMADAGFDHDTGYGLVDATAALAQATGGNLVPLAVADFAATDQNTATSIAVLANDAPGNPPTALSIETAASHGSAAVNGSTIDYTPGPDYFGPDSFQYRITDADNEFSVATVNVTVNEVNVAPLAANDNAVTNEDVVASNIDVLANDNLGNLPTTITAVGPGVAGSTVTTDGSTVTYWPAPNWSGDDVFPYTITDADGDTANANLTVSVIAVNDPPMADNDATATDEDTPVVFNDALMLAGDSDIENDPLSITQVFNTSAQGGVVSSDGGGNYTYTPPANFNGSDAVNYVVSDGTDTDTGTVVISVAAVNDAPDAASVANQTSQDGDSGISVDAATTDVDGDALTYAISGQPANLSINSSTGAITGTIDANASRGGPQGDGIYAVTVTANDASVGTDYQFTWTVSAGQFNNSPNPRVVADQTNQDGDTVTPVDAATTDPDGDLLSYSASGLPAGISINVTTGLISGTLSNSASQGGVGGVHTVTVTASDGLSTPTNYGFAWTVTNPAPVALADNDSTNEDVAAVIDVLGNDSDPDGDGLSVSAVTQGASGTVTNNGANVTYTPNANFNGADSFTYTVSDGNGGFDTATVNVTVNAVNDQPIAGDDNATTDQDVAVAIDVLTNDSDPDGDGLIITAVSQGTNGTVAINGNSVTYTPTAGFSGGDNFTYDISDGNGGAATATVTVTVNPVTTPIHVGDLDGEKVVNGVRWDALVTITIHNGSEGTVAGATVSGSWSNGTNGGANCVTDGAGRCTVSKQNLKNNVVSVDFTVTGVTGSNLSYTGVGNHDPDADSDGTTITVPPSTGGGGNAAPTASFTYSCADLACSFDASGSSDSDGTIVAYGWDFGDSATGSGTNPNHSYAAAGTYTVTLTVTDDLGATGQNIQNISVGSGAGGPTLGAAGYKVKGIQNVDLTWGGATTADVQVFRDGGLVATTANDGAYTDNIGVKGSGTYNYWVCEAGGGACSNIVAVVF